MWKLLSLSILQSMILSGGQVLLKYALIRMGEFCWSREFIINQLTNWWLIGFGLCYGIGSLLWMYIVKNFPLSMAYPMISLSYVFGMFCAIIFFHENIPLTRWVGVFMIVSGCCLIAK